MTHFCLVQFPENEVILEIWRSYYSFLKSDWFVANEDYFHVESDWLQPVTATQFIPITENVNINQLVL